MNHCSTIFRQLLALLPRHQFDKAVKDFQTDRYVKKFSTWNQLLANLFAQITGKRSLRDIVTALSARANRWYHLGLVRLARSTLAHANAKRNAQVFEALFYAMLERFRQLAPRHKFRFKKNLYSLDSTTIDLCLSLFPWADFRRRKGAIKLHCLLDHRGEIPSFLVLSEGRQHDVTIAKESPLPLSPDSILVLDRAYIDFKWLWELTSLRVFFVTRAKSNFAHQVIGQQEPQGRGVMADQTVELTGARTGADYPRRLRLVTYVDEDSQKVYRFLTSNFRLSAGTIAAIYKERWKIELFFKWIKQHLKIKTFLGTSKNAVLAQIWTAMIYCLLLAYVKFQTRFKSSLLELSRMIQELLFEPVSLLDLLSLNSSTLHKLKQDNPQMLLF